jgi:hypothetical protein
MSVFSFGVSSVFFVFNIILRVKFSLPPEFSGVFQFEPQSFKIGSLPPLKFQKMAI